MCVLVRVYEGREDRGGVWRERMKISLTGDMCVRACTRVRGVRGIII